MVASVLNLERWFSHNDLFPESLLQILGENNEIEKVVLV
jgi:hypothetical protein